MSLIRLPLAAFGLGPPKPARKKPRALNYPAREELHYASRLLNVVRETEAQIRAGLFPLLPQLTRQVQRTDGAAEDLERVLGPVRLGISLESATGIAVEMLQRVQILQGGQFVEAYEDLLAINPFVGSESWLPEQMALRTTQNVALIRSLPEDLLFDVQSVTTREILAGTHARDIATLLRERFDIAENRALTIATDQVGKWFGGLNKLRQQDAGVTEYIWRTAGDGNVRPAHAALNGNKREWGEGLEPGQAIRCRCQAIPVIPDFDEEG